MDQMFKALDTHRQLLALPGNIASEKFAQLPQEQQADLKKRFGEDTVKDPNRGWLQSAAHYVKEYNPLTLAFKGVVEASDLMTRLYRTVSIAGDQDVALFGKGNAWDIANDKGDKVFRPKAIEEAKAKYGVDRVEAAMKLASGLSFDEAFAQSNEAGKAALTEYKNDTKSNLFTDALEAVNQSKYSPGRDFASALGLRGTGAYKWVSGLGDAVFRVVADPTLLAGKAKRMYDVSKYSVSVITGNSAKIANYFSKPAAREFWDQYGSLLGKLEVAETKASKEMNKVNKAIQQKKTLLAVIEDPTTTTQQLAKANSTVARIDRFLETAPKSSIRAAEEAAAVRTQLERMAPDLGPTVVKEFNRPDVKIRSAKDLENFLTNGGDMEAIMSGQAARVVPLMPRLNAARKARIAMYTTADRVFNINKIGPDFLRALYVSEEGTQTGDIITGIVRNPEQLASQIKSNMATKRFTLDDVWKRIDRFASKFEKIPHTKDGLLVVTDPNAVKTVYQIARLSLPRYHSKIIAEAFNASGVGKKKEILNGLWETVASVRGVNKTEAGQKLLSEIRGAVNKAYSGEITIYDEAGNKLRSYNPGVVDDVPMAVGEWQLSDAVAMPSLRDLDVMASRDGVVGWVVGKSHSEWVEKLTNYWSFLTLAGPRFAVRNAIEDLMMHLAVGNSPWGIAKGRYLSTIIRTSRETNELGVINRFVQKSNRDKYATKINAIKASDISDEKKVTEIRQLMANAVSESKLGFVFSDDELRFVSEHIQLGGLDNALADVAEGARNMMTGTDAASVATALQKKYGAVSVLEFDKKLYMRGRGKSGFGVFDPSQSTANKVSWLNLINVWAKDSLGKIALENIDNVAGNKKAIEAVAKHLRENPSLFKRFRGEARNVTEQQHAQRVVDTVASLFSKGDGKMNMEFFSTAVKNGKIHVSELSVSDLPSLTEDMPRQLSGPTFIPVAEGENITSSLIDRGWDWMGNANARYSREPIMLDAMLRIRKKMANDGFETKYIDTLVNQGFSKEYAQAQLAQLAEQRAVAYTLQYVDNPAVRTQIAFASRNFARFYRATEDFYRRIVRSVRYNPDAIARAALTYEGISHSGWIQEDANGEKYFLYPALAPVYKAMQATLALAGVTPAFKAPLPVQFGGKLNMITPSMNPESLMPTFSGPLAAVSVNVISNIVGLWDPEKKTQIQTSLLGPYAANQNLIEAVLPAHINRAYAALSKDDRDGQYASAFRKAVTYLAAADKAPKTKIDPVTGEEIPPSASEMEKYQDQLKSMTASILFTRFVFGFVAPASPQIDYKSDMADWVRDSGRSSWKQVWNGLLQQYDGDPDRAMADWAKYFPNEMPYTVSENNKQVATYIRASEKAGNFLKDNRDLFERYPEGAAFLMPTSGDFTYESYKILRDNGLYAPKAVGDFLKEVQSAGDYAFYQQRQSKYEAQLASTPFDWEKKQLRDEWLAWSQAFKGSRPYLQERLANYATIRPQKITALNDLVNMLNDKSVKVQPKTQAALRRMLDLYNQYNDLKSSPLNDSSMGDMAKAGIVEQMQQIAGANPNAGAAYSSIFSFLMGVKE